MSGLVFALTTGQYGFILNACVYAAIYLRNWLRWRREEHAARNDPAALAIDARRNSTPTKGN